jgi:hypothetical protein
MMKIKVLKLMHMMNMKQIKILKNRSIYKVMLKSLKKKIQILIMLMKIMMINNMKIILELMMIDYDIIDLLRHEKKNIFFIIIINCF